MEWAVIKKRLSGKPPQEGSQGETAEQKKGAQNTTDDELVSGAPHHA
jgi:hypothetical protein